MAAGAKPSACWALNQAQFMLGAPNERPILLLSAGGGRVCRMVLAWSLQFSFLLNSA